MADLLGIEQTNYSRFERRDNKLTIEQLQQIAAAMGVTIRDFLFEEKESKEEMNFEIERLRMENEILKLKKNIKEAYDQDADTVTALLKYFEMLWEEAFDGKQEPDTLKGVYHKSVSTAFKYCYIEGGGSRLERICIELGFDKAKLIKPMDHENDHKANLKLLIDFLKEKYESANRRDHLKTIQP